MDQLERQRQQYEMKQRKQLGLSAPQGGALLNKEFDRFYSTFIQVFKSIEHQLQQGHQREQSPSDLKMVEILA